MSVESRPGNWGEAVATDAGFVFAILVNVLSRILLPSFWANGVQQPGLPPLRTSRNCICALSYLYLWIWLTNQSTASGASFLSML